MKLGECLLTTLSSRLPRFTVCIIPQQAVPALPLPMFLTGHISLQLACTQSKLISFLNQFSVKFNPFTSALKKAAVTCVPSQRTAQSQLILPSTPTHNACHRPAEKLWILLIARISTFDVSLNKKNGWYLPSLNIRGMWSILSTSSVWWNLIINSFRGVNKIFRFTAASRALCESGMSGVLSWRDTWLSCLADWRYCGRYTYTYTHTHIIHNTHTYIHTNTHTHIHTYTHTYIHTYTHTHKYTQTHTHIHTRTYIHT